MRLSLAMVVGNEVLTIERSISSVRAHVDEVVVGLDARSSDGTAEIVERLADKVLVTRLSEELELKGPVDGGPDWGFSKARNQVLDACDPSSWRLILDGHETVLNPEEMEGAVAEAMAGSYDGIEVTVRFEPGDDGIPQTMFASKRLLAPGVRYINPNHNAPVVSRRHNARHVMVEHRKSDQAVESKAARDRQRAASNVEGLRAKVEAEPENSRAWFYLATAYSESGMNAEAIEAFERCLGLSRFDEERWHARVGAGLCHSRLCDWEPAREQFVKATEERPVMVEAYYYLADLACKQQRYSEAEGWLLKCIEMTIPDCRMFVNPRVYMVDRYDLLSMVYHHLGRHDLAIRYAEKALEAAPNDRIGSNVSIWKEMLGGG